MTIKRCLWGTSALLTVISGAMLLASGQVAAQGQSASAAAMLEEIVVTARRRTESLQDLPLSIVAITADQMQAQGIYNIEQLGEFVPNVTLTSDDRANNTRVIIRGIGGGHPDPTNLFGSGMYIDGHYIAYSVGGYMSTLDIERIEILRGPQGTLFGRNTTGGAINIISAKPGPEFDSSLTLRVGEYGQQDIRGMINFPISDNVFARISAASEQSDGYYFNRNLGIDTGGTDLTAVTGTLRFTPGDHWTIDATLSVAENRDDNLGGQCRIDPTQGAAWGGSNGGAGHVEYLGVGANDAFRAECDANAALGPFVNSSEKVTFSNIDQDGAFVVATWDSDGPVGGLDNLTVKTIASWRDIDYIYLQDRDMTSFQVDGIGTPGPVGQVNLTRNFEIVFEAEVNDRLDFVAGVNFFEDNVSIGENRCFTIFTQGSGGTGPFDPANPNVDIRCDPPITGLLFERPPYNTTGLNTLPGPGPGWNNITQESESLGVFGHVKYALNDDWILEVGARWTEDDRYFNNIEFPAFACDITVNPTGLCPAQQVMNATSIGDGFFNERSDTWSEVTPSVSLTRNLTSGDTLESGMVYFLISEGFLSGGFNTEINLTAAPELAPFGTFEPEQVINYEVGFKGTFNDGRLRLMADVFFMDYTDKQQQINLDNSDGRFGAAGNVDINQNVAKAEIYGLELELRASLWDGGFISVDAGYLNNEFSAPFATALPTTSNLLDLGNANIADLSADWTLNATIEHTFQLGSGATLTPQLGVYAQGDYEWSGSAVSRDAPDTMCHQDAYSKWRARVTFVPAAGNYQVALFGSNINDELIYGRCGDGRAGTRRYRHEKPDAWGLEFTARWGDT